jgi:hypothetical protein
MSWSVEHLWAGLPPATPLQHNDVEAYSRILQRDRYADREP